MTRAELNRLLHAARVEAYGLALFDTGPRPANNEQEQRWRQWYREDAERKVTEYERHGLFILADERGVA